MTELAMPISMIDNRLVVEIEVSGAVHLRRESGRRSGLSIPSGALGSLVIRIAYAQAVLVRYLSIGWRGTAG